MTTEVTPKITLHWAPNTRAERILFLLEEMHLPYTLKCYPFNPLGSPRVPIPEETNPLQSVPMVELTYPDHTVKLLESGHIVEELLKFDKEKKVTPSQKEKMGFHLHFAEASLMLPLINLYVSDLGTQGSPWYLRPIIGAYNAKLDQKLNLPKLEKYLEFLENELQGEWFLGEFSAVDIMYSTPFGLFYKSAFIKDAVTGSYSKLDKWWAALTEREGYKRAQEIKKKVLTEELSVYEKH